MSICFDLITLIQVKPGPLIMKMDIHTWRKQGSVRGRLILASHLAFFASHMVEVLVLCFPSDALMFCFDVKVAPVLKC